MSILLRFVDATFYCATAKITSLYHRQQREMPHSLTIFLTCVTTLLQLAEMSSDGLLILRSQ